ncbi:CLUMA_CG020994, isoform A [Clunio marinus]|uniref:CLUMA_CG020994, isoform A n=1 Tax=Clunio marinus TaxID=568069 RepID=A0A1J1J6Q6_9DIPT|nr:CLUMA_CG020994, isoform A [Clunio marinus]
MSQLEQVYEPRLCHVSKRADFDGYGFNLHAEKGRPGQYIGKVDVNSPAESSGLRQGDRILEVNGVSIGADTHKQVVEKIKAISEYTKLLIIDPKADINNPKQLEAIEKMKATMNSIESQEKNNSHTDMNSSEDNKDISRESRSEKDEATLETFRSEDSEESSVGVLQLPITVAEMRAQLKNKKRPDPKTEGLDVRKKYDIIQKM